ncbi:DUF512 domain-containing protein [bacterium]|nr:DUF512 domain-containing protein [bacterium]
MLQIVEIEPRSPANRAGLLKDDVIVSAGGKTIRDALDIEFYIEGETYIDLLIERGDKEIPIRLLNLGLKPSGIIVEPLKIRHCGNKCVFCFVDQQPKGLRDSLYIKDEDVRFSFIYGNYVTLTNTPEWEIKRVIEQKMSPLYISVHSTDEEIRRNLLSNKKIKPIFPLLHHLTENGIAIHSQIVVVPGYNSNTKQLESTIKKLYSLGENSLSCALVPLGITDYRRELASLESINFEQAKDIIFMSNNIRDSIERPEFLQLADEFFVLAGENFPQSDYYDDYPQLENGVGMARLFIDDTINALNDNKIANILSDKTIDIVTGLSAAELFKKLLPKDLGIKGCLTRIIGVKNSFWGNKVNVANLLTGKDIVSVISNSDADYIFLPPKVLNEDGLFLDGMSIETLQTSVKGRVMSGMSYLSEIQEVILNN